MHCPLRPEVLFSRLLEDALDAVIIIDEQCRIRYINGAMQALSGYASGELLGETLNGLLPDAVAAQHDNHVINYIRSSRQSSVLGKIRNSPSATATPDDPHRDEGAGPGRGHGMRYFGAFLLDVRERRNWRRRTPAAGAAGTAPAMPSPRCRTARL
jgi:PAS domain-containing protein